MKIDRLMGIVIQLINHERLTAKQLAEHFDVSVRTIKRDMDTLTIAGIPIYAELGQLGGYQLMDHFRLKENYLNNNEAEILMAFLNGLKESSPMEDVIAIHSKFSSLNKDCSNNDKLKVIINPVMNADVIKEKMQMISRARDEHLKLSLSYINQELVTTKRIVHPYTLVMIGTQWYLYAFCEKRSDFRIFKLHRISKIQALETQFLPRELPPVKPWETMMDTGREGTKVVLLIEKCLMGRLPDYIDMDKCEWVEGGLKVELNFPIDEWFYSFLMGMIPHVKVLEPTCIRDEFLRRIKKTLNDHQ